MPLRALNIAFAAAFICAGGALAQADAEWPLQTTTSEGAAEATVSPEIAEFTLRRAYTAASVYDAVEESGSFGPLLAESLDAIAVEPLEVVIDEPVVLPREANRANQAALPDEGGRSSKSADASEDAQDEAQAAPRPQVSLSAVVRYELSPYQHDGGMDDFARLVDAIRVVARHLQAESSGPDFRVSNPRGLERKAIGEAVKAAYPKAAAVAGIMPASIAYVKDVEVKQVTWNPANRPASLNRITCEAVVRVTYVLDSL